MNASQRPAEEEAMAVDRAGTALTCPAVTTPRGVAGVRSDDKARAYRLAGSITWIISRTRGYTSVAQRLPLNTP